jgi:predicted outer membrane repeat protein
MLTVIESQIAFNWADDNGGGIYNKGELTVVHCILNNNLSGNTGLAMPGKGGAIYTSGTGTYELDGIVSIDSSTFDNNVSGAGGAIYAGDTAFAPIVRNSTFTNNNAFEHGGAIYDMPIISIINSTIALNGAGGGAQAGGGIYTLRTELTSTIIANSRLVSINAPNVDQITISVLDSSDNCAGPITNGGVSRNILRLINTVSRSISVPRIAAK